MIFFILTIIFFSLTGIEINAMNNIKKDSIFYVLQLSRLEQELSGQPTHIRKDILYQLGKTSYFYSKKLEEEGKEEKTLLGVNTVFYLREAKQYFNWFISENASSVDLKNKLEKAQNYVAELADL